MKVELSAPYSDKVEKYDSVEIYVEEMLDREVDYYCGAVEIADDKGKVALNTLSRLLAHLAQKGMLNGADLAFILGKSSLYEIRLIP